MYIKKIYPSVSHVMYATNSTFNILEVSLWKIFILLGDKEALSFLSKCTEIV